MMELRPYLVFLSVSLVELVLGKNWEGLFLAEVVVVVVGGLLSAVAVDVSVVLVVVVVVATIFF